MKISGCVRDTADWGVATCTRIPCTKGRNIYAANAQSAIPYESVVVGDRSFPISSEHSGIYDASLANVVAIAFVVNNTTCST